MRPWTGIKRTERFAAQSSASFKIIGEAMMQLRGLRPEMARRITASDQIVGFRHVIVHGYFDLKAETVWDVVQNKLPTLAREVADMLPQGSL